MDGVQGRSYNRILHDCVSSLFRLALLALQKAEWGLLVNKVTHGECTFPAGAAAVSRCVCLSLLKLWVWVWKGACACMCVQMDAHVLLFCTCLYFV